MIPKVIHYCWFGENPLPESALKCIASWKKYCPDYEIREWNESNFDLDSCNYIREAYQEKKWAFISDYARFWIIYNYGGLYFDTDVEILKPMEKIVETGPFFGFERRDEDGSNQMLVATGLGMGAEAGNTVYREILDIYSNLHFLDKDGFQNKKTVVLYVTELLQKYGLETSEKAPGEPVRIKGITIYPWEYFCPMSYKTGELTITDSTYTIHHYTSSWKSPLEIKIKNTSDKMVKKMVKLFGKKAGVKIAKIICIPMRIIDKIKKYGIIKVGKIILKRGKDNA